MEIDSDGIRHTEGVILTVSGKHDDIADSEILKGGDGHFRVVLYLVGYHDMACVDAVNRDMDSGSGQFAGMPTRSYALHHGGVAYAHRLSVDMGLDTLSGDLLHIPHFTVVMFIRVCFLQGQCYRVRRESFHMGGEMEKFLG